MAMQPLTRMDRIHAGDDCCGHCNSARCMDDSACHCRGTLRGIGRLICALSAVMVVVCVYILVR